MFWNLKTYTLNLIYKYLINLLSHVYLTRPMRVFLNFYMFSTIHIFSLSRVSHIFKTRERAKKQEILWISRSTLNSRAKLRDGLSIRNEET